MGRFLFYILNLIFVVLLGWILRRALGRFLAVPGGRIRDRQDPSPSARAVRGETARDPVCGMFVSTEVSHRLVRGQETVHFCSRECLERYEKDAASVPPVRR